jgi:glycosyltransferase involved in cell wall biosynthesis
MKFLFGIKSLTVCRGGAERVLTNLCSELADRGHEVFVVTFDKPERELLYPMNHKITVIKTDTGDTKKETSAFDFIRRIFTLRRVTRKVNPDVVIGFMSSIFILFAFSLIGTKYLLVASEHIVPQYYKKRRLEFYLLIFAGMLSKKITVVSNRVKQLYPRIIRHKIVAINNPVTIKGCNPNGGSDKTTILNIGRLNSQKDHETLIRAFALLHNKYPEWDLRIVGDGDLRSFLQELSRKLLVDSKVIFVGSVENIEDEYKSASFFAMSSLFESFGLVTVEAMACQLPVVGFQNCPGTNELVVDKVNGILVSGNDRVNSFAAGMELLMTDKKLYKSLKENTRKTAERFSIKVVTSTWEDLLRKVVN